MQGYHQITDDNQKKIPRLPRGDCVNGAMAIPNVIYFKAV